VARVFWEAAQAEGMKIRDSRWAVSWDAASAAMHTTWGPGTSPVDTSLYVAAIVARLGIEEAQQAALLREILGNPFRPVFLEQSWVTNKVKGLAEDIYERRAFSRLPDLADALEEAGCSNAEILSHGRSSGPHGPGCWLVDLLCERKFDSVAKNN